MSPLPVQRYSHMAFRVKSLERSRAFYEHLFGYTPFIETPLEHQVLELLTGGTSSRARLVMGGLGDKVLELVEYEGLPDRQVGFSHFAISVADLDATHAGLRERGADILMEPGDVSGTRLMFVEDPDGNRFEIAEFPEWPIGDAPMGDPDAEARAFLEAWASLDAEKILQRMTARPRWAALGRTFEGAEGVRARVDAEAAAWQPGSLRHELEQVTGHGPDLALRCTTHGRTPEGETRSRAQSFFLTWEGDRIQSVHEYTGSAA